ncbi:MAG: hypothetical protein NTZ42_02895 [Candidatus Gribaldobacteria bacterium]|nr:hypothetical protein [Candidatus Gribaldobacteria bacterium]
MVEVCPKRNLFISFLDWHFHETTLNIIKAWQNFLSFNLRYFSVGELLRTLFSHWHRMGEGYGRGFDLQRFFSVFIGNMFSRVLGAIARSIFIVVGLVVELFILLAGLVALLFWVLLPVWVLAAGLAIFGLLLA